MAYADSIRAETATMNEAATLIEGIFGSTYGLTWTSWVPTLGAGGSMTYTSTTVHYAKYVRSGKMIIYIVNIDGTTGGTPSTTLTFTVPVNIASAYSWSGGGVVNEAGTLTSGFASYTSATTLSVYKYNAAAYGAGANRNYVIGGVYECV